MPSIQSIQRREQRRKLPKAILDRNHLVIKHLGLAHHAAIHQAARYPGEQHDLVQEGCLGLIHGMANFDPNRGFRISTYALARVNGQILHFRRDRQHSLRLPWRLKDLYSRGMRLQAQRLQERLEPLDEWELAQALKVSHQRWKDALVAHANGNVGSLDVAPGFDSTKGEPRSTLINLIEDPSTVQELLDDQPLEWLQGALSSLAPKQSDWLRARYIDHLSINELALRENVDPRLLRQSIRDSLSQLRKAAHDQFTQPVREVQRSTLLKQPPRRSAGR